MKQKACTRCKKTKDLSEFGFHKSTKDGLCHFCKQCKSKMYYDKKSNIDEKIRTIYNNQISHSKPRGHNPPVYSLKEFSEYCKNETDFIIYFNKWVKSGFDKRKAPSFNRIKDDIGYTIDNIELMTWGENDNDAASKRRNGLINSSSKLKPVIMINPKTKEKREYISISEAARINNIGRCSISACLRKITKTAGGFKWEYK